LVGSTDSAVRRRLVVHGRVQGVFFRASCRDEANARGVTGSADNLDDGAVEVVLEGEQTAVDEMVAWARTGPAHAEVSGVDVYEERLQGLSGFTVS